MAYTSDISNSTDKRFNPELAPRKRRMPASADPHLIRIVPAKRHGFKAPPKAWGIEFSEVAQRALEWWTPERQHWLYRSLKCVREMTPLPAKEGTEAFRLDEEDVVVIDRSAARLTVVGIFPLCYFGR